ncbi:hypothetical protein A0H81_14507 [Grifola frondosa]|uniref:C-factor n=1 Tax=Grifola frondosa TaxID=5627 RepID=A0A1C7LLI4_GRIFR|nr:hypothetical protein A0H81_14507 [Grifola frondosa]
MSTLESFTWLITGSSRGIGLELTRQLLTSPVNTVIATCRDPTGASALTALQDGAQGTLHIIALDVADEVSIRTAVKEAAVILGERGLDYLYNNAAINETDDTAFSFDPARLARAVHINVVGPALLAQACLPLLEKSTRKVVVNMTSGLASIGLDCGPKCTTYSISKAALNMLTYKQAKERSDFIVVCLDPGWVKTDMGGDGAMLEREFSVSHILKVVTALVSQDTGKFFRYNGEQLPW